MNDLHRFLTLSQQILKKSGKIFSNIPYRTHYICHIPCITSAIFPALPMPYSLHYLYVILPIGHITYTIFPALHLPCSLHYICHIPCITYAIFPVLPLPYPMHYICHIPCIFTGTGHIYPSTYSLRG